MCNYLWRDFVRRLGGNASRIHVEAADDNESLYFSSEPDSTNETVRRRPIED